MAVSIVYKVVLRDPFYYSTRIFRSTVSWCGALTYRIGHITEPKVGQIMAFNSIEHAHEFMVESIQSKWTVMLSGYAINPRPIKWVMALRDLPAVSIPYLSKWWEHQFDNTEPSGTPYFAPLGSMGCMAFRPIEVLYEVDPNYLIVPRYHSESL